MSYRMLLLLTSFNIALLSVESQKLLDSQILVRYLKRKYHVFSASFHDKIQKLNPNRKARISVSFEIIQKIKLNMLKT